MGFSSYLHCLHTDCVRCGWSSIFARDARVEGLSMSALRRADPEVEAACWMSLWIGRRRSRRKEEEVRGMSLWCNMVIWHSFEACAVSGSERWSDAMASQIRFVFSEKMPSAHVCPFAKLQMACHKDISALHLQAPTAPNKLL